MFVRSILICVSALAVLSETLALPDATVDGARLRQATRADIMKRLEGSKTGAKRAAISGTTFPTCAESGSTSGTPYATLNGAVASFNGPGYYIYPTYDEDTVAACAQKCDATQSCVAGAVHDSLCFLWDQVPASTQQSGGFQTFVSGGCSALPSGIDSTTCCNTYVGV